MDIYQAGIRPLLFSGFNVDPEQAHHSVMGLLQWLDQHQNHGLGRSFQHQIQRSCCFSHPALAQTLWGLTFPNPIGLAAGFDKDGIAVGIWPSLGFGFTEVGTVTLHAQPGNPKPRLFRLLPDHAVLNRMGFNNRGAAAMAAQFNARSLASVSTPLGINLGKSKVTPLDRAAEDYCQSFQQLREWGDYFVINVSSPNTPGLRSLQSADQLERIICALQQENQDQIPLLIKIAPDLEWEAIADVLSLAQQYHLAGIIATNTTITREGLATQILPKTGHPITEEAGGISGVPLRQRATEVIRFIYQKTQGQLPIIGVGGVFTANDAWEKIAAGASLIQVYTGWVYEGPWMVRRILQGIVQRLQERGWNSITDAIGKET